MGFRLTDPISVSSLELTSPARSLEIFSVHEQTFFFLVWLASLKKSRERIRYFFTGENLHSLFCDFFFNLIFYFAGKPNSFFFFFFVRILFFWIIFH
jgi:hypothetical protein